MVMDLVFSGLFSLKAITAVRSMAITQSSAFVAMPLRPLALCLLRQSCSFNLELTRSRLLYACRASFPRQDVGSEVLVDSQEIFSIAFLVCRIRNHRFSNSPSNFAVTVLAVRYQASKLKGSEMLYCL